MKQIILLITCMFILFHASAQEQTKSLFVTANVGGYLQNDAMGRSYKSFNISPSINYLLNDRWSIGLATRFYTGVTKSEMGETKSTNGYYSYYERTESKDNSWWLGPQVRYYFPAHDKIFLFGEIQTGAQFKSLKSYGYHSSIDYNDLYGGQVTQETKGESKSVSLLSFISPGLVYFIKPTFGIEMKVNVLRYNYGISDSRIPDDETKAQELKLDFSLANSLIGASFYF